VLFSKRFNKGRTVCFGVKPREPGIWTCREELFKGDILRVVVDDDDDDDDDDDKLFKFEFVFAAVSVFIMGLNSEY